MVELNFNSQQLLLQLIFFQLPQMKNRFVAEIFYQKMSLFDIQKHYFKPRMYKNGTN
jgi:hypothetical protein